MHKLFLILFVLLYVDDVYFWVDKKDRVTPTQYSTIVQEASTDTIANPIQKDQIEIIHAQDTTVTVVVRRH